MTLQPGFRGRADLLEVAPETLPLIEKTQQLLAGFRHADSVTIDLSGMPGSQKCVAVDAKADYSEIVEYMPTLNETLVCFGIWAAGLFLYSVLVRITVPVLSGELVVVCW